MPSRFAVALRASIDRMSPPPVWLTKRTRAGLEARSHLGNGRSSSVSSNVTKFATAERTYLRRSCDRARTQGRSEGSATRVKVFATYSRSADFKYCFAALRRRDFRSFHPDFAAA